MKTIDNKINTNLSELEILLLKKGFNEDKYLQFRKENHYVFTSKKKVVYYNESDHLKANSIYKALKTVYGGGMTKSASLTMSYPGTVIGGAMLAVYLSQIAINPLFVVAAVMVPAVGGLVGIVSSALTENKKHQESVKYLADNKSTLSYDKKALAIIKGI